MWGEAPDPRKDAQSKLTAFLAMPRRDNENAEQFCARQAEHFGPGVFSRAIHHLTNLKLSETEARSHWRAIVDHREDMSAMAEREIGLLTTVVDYFTSVAPLLDRPVALEADALALCQRLMMMDDLTGLYNRRYFSAELQKEIERSRRLDRPMALLMADIDHFKEFNDTFGHAAGDRALAAVGRVMRASARLMDQPVRYGGEEFAFILPHTSKEDAMVVAERLRSAIQAHPPVDESGMPLSPVTLSIGLASCPEDGEDPIALIEAADRALYRAKGRGRNQVCTQSDDFRRARRYPTCSSAECLINSGGSPMQGRILDLSPWGVRCEVPTDIQPGEPLSLVLRDEARSLTLPLNDARTVWAENASNGLWRAGISFGALSDPQRDSLHSLIGLDPGRED